VNRRNSGGSAPGTQGALLAAALFAASIGWAEDLQTGRVTGHVTVRAKDGAASANRRRSAYDSVRLRRARRFDYQNPGEIVVHLEALAAVPQAAPPPVPGGETPTTLRLVRAARGLRWHPSSSVVSVGTLVEFVNEDSKPHIVYSKSSTDAFQYYLDELDSQGASRSVRIKAIGPVEIQVLDAEGVQGMLYVAGRHHQVLSGSAEFELPRVPAGPYRITAWHPRLPVDTRIITVTNGASTHVALDLSVNHLPKVSPDQDSP